VDAFAPLPRPPCPPWQRKLSHSPDPTAPHVGSVPHSQPFLQPHLPNHAKLAEMSETFSISVSPFAFIVRQDNPIPTPGIQPREQPPSCNGRYSQLFFAQSRQPHSDC
jgi:hypothetical protein